MLKLKLIFICILLSNVAFGQFRDKDELKNVTTEILDLIKKYSIVSDSINWIEYKIEIETEINKMADVDSTRDWILKILKPLRQYGDSHSHYSNKTRSDKYLARKDSLLLPSSKLLEQRIGYIYLPSHPSMNSDENYLYADTLRKQIQDLDQNYNIKGWIVDLRKNSGGNMWPMLAGLNPLLEDNTVGYFVSNSNIVKWESNSENPQHIPKMNNLYKCKNLKARIAILIDTLTASSGEMTAISLLGIDNSKSFGNPSAGLTTANVTFKLSNGANLFLASSYCTDRKNKVYKGKIQPDMFVENATVIQKAIQWIENQ